MYEYSHLVFGLRWETTLSDDPKEREDSARVDKANVYVEYRFDNSTNIGFGRVKKAKNLASGAAVFAAKVNTENAIFIHSLPDEQVCLVVLQGFMPTLDSVVDRDEALNLIKDTVLQYKDMKKIIKVFGDIEIEEISEEMGGASVVDLPFEIEPMSLTELDAISLKSGYTLKELSGDFPVFKIVFSVTVIAILVVCYLEFFGSSTPAAQAKQEDPKLQHKQQVANLVKGISDSRSFPSQVISRYLAFANDVAWKVPGWELNQLECVATACTARYDRKPGGSAKGFLMALRISNTDNAVKFLDTEHVTRELQFAADPLTQPLQLTQLNLFNKYIVSWFQGLHDAGYQSSFSVAGPLLPAPPGVNADPSDLIRTGEYTFSVPYTELHQAAAIPNYITIQSITAKTITTPITTVTVEIKGKYYAY